MTGVGLPDRFALFVGAGISKIHPTTLPDWNDYNRALIMNLTAEASRLGDVWRPLADRIERARADDIPSEFFSQVIANRLGPPLLQSCLSSRERSCKRDPPLDRQNGGARPTPSGDHHEL